MRNFILDFPKQFKEALEIAKDINIEGDFNNVVFSGMGGSGWPAEVLMAWLQPKFYWSVNRTYNLPPQVDSKTLAIFVSFSGNTEECLSSFKEALEKDVKTVAVTSGGKLKELCEENNIPCIVIPSQSPDFQPRLATGYMVAALASILTKAGLIEDKSKEILSLGEILNPAESEEQGKELAKKLKNTIPLFYASDQLRTLTYVWKIKINENAKSPAFADRFPELNHNEMEGLAHLQEKDFSTSIPFHAIIFQDSNDHPRVLKRMKITTDILSEQKMPVENIELKGNNLLEKIFNSLILADWVTYYLCKEYNVEPLPIPAISKFKKEMGK